MDAKNYNMFLSAIKTANDNGDKEMLRQIQAMLIVTYGPDDKDVSWLLSQFRYNV